MTNTNASRDAIDIGQNLDTIASYLKLLVGPQKRYNSELNLRYDPNQGSIDLSSTPVTSHLYISSKPPVGMKKIMNIWEYSPGTCMELQSR